MARLWAAQKTAGTTATSIYIASAVGIGQELLPVEGRSRGTWPEGRAPLVYKHVYKRQQEGPFRNRKRPLTCEIGSGGRI